MNADKLNVICADTNKIVDYGKKNYLGPFPSKTVAKGDCKLLLNCIRTCWNA